MIKNPDRVEFEKKCKAFEKRTLFLRVFVIYIIPFYIVCSIAAICSLVINKHKFATGEIVLTFMFELIKSAFMYVTRREAFKLSKKSYYYLYICAAFICLTGLITEGIQMLPRAAIIFFYFLWYLSKRSFLFGID